jgi:hypothetical protein
VNDITDIVSRLRRTDENRGVAICSEAADTIEQLRKERDEARQEICIQKCDSLGALIGGSPASPQHYAEERGWDCFSDKAEADANNTLFRTTDGE